MSYTNEEMCETLRAAISVLRERDALKPIVEAAQEWSAAMNGRECVSILWGDEEIIAVADAERVLLAAVRAAKEEGR